MALDSICCRDAVRYMSVNAGIHPPLSTDSHGQRLLGTLTCRNLGELTLLTHRRPGALTSPRNRVAFEAVSGRSTLEHFQVRPSVFANA